MELENVIYEVSDGVATITLNRPQAANAQSHEALAELDQAWQAADRDPAVKVIIMRSNGKHFSAGHDMSRTKDDAEPETWPAEKLYDWEMRGYLHYAKSWRAVPKPSIAAVQGKCIAGGLMLCWPCDLIVAADNAEFSDPVLALGICGVELHAHTWELGPRKAKELLFTGEPIAAAQAQQLGMVNRVVPLDELETATMALARRIARNDAVALRMAKRAVNHTLDLQGYTNSIDSIFDMHHFGHARAQVVTGGIPVLTGLAGMKGKGSNKGKGSDKGKGEA
ncbi:MAG: enoyl-CoA hydratase [Myxococcales bacterium]|nr:enoyl-CoA hydratase [Myxococcales bacterium]MDD9967236.1 enoyl-CoA hydratase [Myxococcales bacterium]